MKGVPAECDQECAGCLSPLAPSDPHHWCPDSRGPPFVDVSVQDLPRASLYQKWPKVVQHESRSERR